MPGLVVVTGCAVMLVALANRAISRQSDALWASQVQRAQERLDERRSMLSVWLVNYALWDELVDYIAHPDLGWEQGNLDWLVDNTAFDVLVVVDTSGKVLYSESPTVAFERGRNVRDLPPVRLGFERPDTDMLWRIGEKAFWLTAGTIERSRTGRFVPPGHGTVILGWRITDAFLQDVSVAAGGKVELVFEEADPSAQPQPKARTATIATLTSFEGNQIASFRLTQDSDIADTSNRAFLALSVFFLLAMALGLGLIGVAADRALVRPLVQLRHAVVDLREKRELSTSLPLERQDELGELAVEVAAFSADLREAERHRGEHQLAREKAEVALRENEEHLRQSQRMEAIGQLAGGIAHDFNNLLTTILGYCELLSARRGKAGADRQIEQIAKAGRRAAALTSQLLAFSRKQVLQARVIDLNAVIAGMRGMLERLISEDVTLVIDLASDLKPVEADPGQIEQVIMNLVVNARDAMPRGGRLKIATRNVDVDGEDASPTSVQTSAEVAVSDTGDGMDAETLQKIFDPFFTTKAPGAGTGLGLSTVHGVVTQSGGEIIASSQPLAGSTFRVRLPHVERALTELSDETAVATPMLDGRERILLVEDDDGVRDLARTILESAGYRVLEASRAATAFEIAETHSIDLLVTDVVMPDESGPELVERMTPLHESLKVLFISGYVNDAVSHDKMPLDRTRLLEKPFTGAQLLQFVRAILDAADPDDVGPRASDARHVGLA